MRFSQAWASVASQNVVLRAVILALSVCLVLLAVVSAKVALKDPLLIERSCYSTVITGKNAEHTQTEVETFLREALSQRFNTESNALSEYLSIDEMKHREQEQAELKRREMRQRVIVNSIIKSGDQFAVDTDRVIAVGSIRSAFSFPIIVSISNVQRTESNPYGLILTQVSGPDAKKEEKANGKK